MQKNQATGGLFLIYLKKRRKRESYLKSTKSMESAALRLGSQYSRAKLIFPSLQRK
jgi:hypothetical protein